MRGCVSPKCFAICQSTKVWLWWLSAARLFIKNEKAKNHSQPWFLSLTRASYVQPYQPSRSGIWHCTNHLPVIHMEVAGLLSLWWSWWLCLVPSLSLGVLVSLSGSVLEEHCFLLAQSRASSPMMTKVPPIQSCSVVPLHTAPTLLSPSLSPRPWPPCSSQWPSPHSLIASAASPKQSAAPGTHTISSDSVMSLVLTSWVLELYIQFT